MALVTVEFRGNLGPNRIKRSVIGMDPYWWEGDLELTVERNPAYVGSMGEATASVSGVCGSVDPAPAVDPPRGPAADKDPTVAPVEARAASLDPLSFDRWLLDAAR